MNKEIEHFINLINGPYGILAVALILVWVAKNKTIIDLIKYTWSRRVNKILFINEYLKNEPSSKNEKYLYTEKRDGLYFEHIYGINVSKKKRNYLIKLYGHLNQEITLESICRAEKFIIYTNDEFSVRGFTNWESLKFYFNIIIFIVLFVFGECLMLYILISGKQSFLLFLASLLVFFCAFGMGVFVASGNWPMVHAKSIREALTRLGPDKN